MSYFEDVVRWHKAVGHPIESYPIDTWRSRLGSELPAKIEDSISLGKDLICEEYNELTDSMYSQDLAGAADAMADLIWVICGLATRLGIDLDKVWGGVRKANFTKIGGPVREDGKQLKPPGWCPPDTTDALENGRNLREDIV